jgi:ribosomal protein S18 acetylase RimI-like enzyme
MKIRPAAPSDLKEIAAIHAASWKDAYSDVFPAEFLAGQIDRHFSNHWCEIDIKNEDIVLVAERNTLVGFIAVWCRPIPFIDNLHVKPSQRSKKIGSALMKAGARELINRGYKTGFLWVFQNNERAIQFYERLGGVKKERARKTVFGYRVPSWKIEWDDLSLIGKV